MALMDHLGFKKFHVMQDEITGAIRDALSERLLGIGVASPQATPQIDAATYELYLRGRHMGQLSDGARANILGLNCARFLGIEVPQRYRH